MAAAGPWDAQAAGEFTGQVLLLVAVGGGMLKCWQISRRDTTNKKAAMGLMLVLLPWFIGGCVTMWTRRLGSRLPLPLFFLFAALLIACVVAALVLAILGLTEISGQSGVYKQGKAQAIWTLVLAGVFGLCIVAGSTGALRSGKVEPTRPGGQWVTYSDLNFRFMEPSWPWVAGARVNKDAKLNYFRRNPEVYFLIIAEKLGTDFTREQLVEVGKANVKAGAELTRVLAERPIIVNGVEGTLVETEATVRGKPLFYQHVYLATNGFAYQLIGFGRAESRKMIADELRGIFQRFEMMDRAKVATGWKGTFQTNFVSADYDYWVDVTNSAWQEFPMLEKELPPAEFGAVRGDSCFMVAPVWWGGEKPEMESMTAGLLSLMQVRYPDAAVVRRGPYLANGLEGFRYDYERDARNAHYYYRLGVLRGEEVGYLVAAWTGVKGEQGQAILDEAFRRVEFGRRSVRFDPQKTFTERARKAQGTAINGAGLSKFTGGEYEEALRLFMAAARANSSEKMYVVNAMEAWRQLDRPREALKFLSTRPEEVIGRPEVRVWQAHFQAETSATEDALTNYARAFESGHRDEARFAEYARLLNHERRHDEALKAIEHYVQREDSIAARLVQAETYRLQQEFSKAVTLLKEQQEKTPSNLLVREGLVEASLDAGLFNEALELSRDIAQRDRRSAYPLYLKGRSELGLKWYREAKSSFEAASRIAPADKTIRSYIDLVRGVMGQGDNSAVQEPIAPVPLPASWTNVVSATNGDEFANGSGAYYEQHVTAISWTAGREHKVTDYARVRLLDSSGVATFSTLQRIFDPLAEQLYVNELRVEDANGKTVSTGKLDDYYVLDDRSDYMATHRRVLNIPVASLQPGFRLVATVTRLSVGKVNEFPFFEGSFSHGFPARESVILLRGDVKGLKYRTTPQLEPEKLPEGLAWRRTEPFVARYEPLEPPLATFAPMLWIADAANGWPSVVTNYLGLISDRLEPDPLVARQAGELVAGLTNRDEKIAALGCWVQTNCTYKAIEFGRRARIPNKAGVVMVNRYGDCKDQALLLQQMLSAAGVPARLALINHGAPVEEELPSLDQFNHVIVFVPGGKGLFIDPTDKGSDPGAGIPAGLEGCSALILDAGNPRFIKVPGPTEGQCEIELNRRLRLVEQEEIMADETLTAHGVQASWLRSFLRNVAPESRKNVFQRQMWLGEAELSEFTVEPLEQASKPLRIHLQYRLRKQFHQTPQGIAGLLRAGSEKLYLTVAPVDKRSTPFELRTPLVVKSMLTIETPEGFSASTPATPALRIDPRFAVCTNTWRVEGQNLVGNFECRRKAGKFSSADYGQYRETMAQIMSLLEREISFTASSRRAN